MPDNRQKSSYEASHGELIGRLNDPIVGFVCNEGPCGWVMIWSGRKQRKTCPVCGAENMRTYEGEGFNEMSEALISSEVALLPDGNEALIKSRLANALERFNERKDDWSLAEEIAREEGAPAHPAGRGWVFNTYRKIRRGRKKKKEQKRKREERAKERVVAKKKEASRAVKEARRGLATSKQRIDRRSASGRTKIAKLKGSRKQRKKAQKLIREKFLKKD